MARPRTHQPQPVPQLVEHPQPAERAPTVEQWQAYAADLAARLAAAEALIVELEAPMPKRTYCYGLPGEPVRWRVAATGEPRARVRLPLEAAGATFRGCA